MPHSPSRPPASPASPARPATGLSIIPDAAIVERKGLVSFISGNERSGIWDLPRHLRVVAVAGAAKLDLRQARVGSGVSEVELFVLAGNVTIVVPPELRVECDVDTLAAGVEFRGTAAGVDAGGPTLRVRGTAIAAAVEIEVRVAGDERPYHKIRRELERGGPG